MRERLKYNKGNRYMHNGQMNNDLGNDLRFLPAQE